MNSVTKYLKRFALGSLIIFCVLVFLGAWALSSPPGSGSDDEYHLAGIWCSQGYRTQVCEESDDKDLKMVPEIINRYSGPLGLFCYVGNSKESGRCIRNLDAASVTELSTTWRISNGYYPDGFYKVNGYFVSGNVNASILRMRILQIVISIGIIGFALSSSGDRTMAILVGLLVGLVPIGLSVIPSTNPSSWAVSGAVGAAICASNLLNAKKPRQRVMSAIGLVAAAVIALQSRRDSALMLVLGILISSLAVLDRSSNGRLSKRRLSQVLFIAALGFVYVHLKFISLDPRVVLNGLNSIAFFEAFTTDAPLVFGGLLGTSAQLGAPDFAPPAIVPILMALGIVCYVAVTKRWLSTIAKVSIVTGAALLFVLPFKFSLGTAGGGVSRYILAIYLVVLATLGASAVQNSRGAFRFSKSAVLTIATSVSIAQSMALHRSLRRYVTGTNVVGWDLNKGAEWWWTYGPSPMSVWILGTVSFAVALSMALSMTNRSRL